MTTIRTFTKPPTSAAPGPRFPVTSRTPCSATSTWCAKIPCARACSTPARKTPSTSPSTMARTGRCSKTTCPPRLCTG
ncbi:MAG: hypothetical protein EPN33_06675 [Acidobacteria bacterium]|nr:MAG: hypothetical protein EPN33_06675 [Acidobacteriota bacterium]